MINIEEYYGFVASIAKKFKQIEFEDAFQSGIEGLIVAANRFDEDESKFTTYAGRYIRGYILNNINTTQNTRYPLKLKTLNTKITKYKRLGYSIEEIAEILKEPLEEVKQAESIYNMFMSAEAIMDDNLIKIRNKEKSVEEQVEIQLEYERVMNELKNLPRIQREILIERFYKDRTQAEVAKERNRTRQAVQNAEKLGLKNIRESLGITI